MERLSFPTLLRLRDDFHNKFHKVVSSCSWLFLPFNLEGNGSLSEHIHFPPLFRSPLPKLRYQRNTITEMGLSRCLPRKSNCFCHVLRISDALRLILSPNTVRPFHLLLSISVIYNKWLSVLIAPNFSVRLTQKSNAFHGKILIYLIGMS